MLTRYLLPALILTTCILPNASAQVGSGPPAYELELSSPGPEGYTRSATGDFDGDGQLDVAYSFGDRTEVVLAPGLYEARMTDVATGATMAVLPGATQDALLVTDLNGIWRVDWTGSGNQPSTLWSRTRLHDDGWRDIISLSTWSNGAETWIFGLRSDGRTVSCLRSTNGELTEDPAYDAPGVFSELVAFDFDGSGDPELGTMDASSVVIHGPGGPTPGVTHRFSGITSKLLVRLHHGSRDWLAWVATSNANGSQLFCTLGQPGMTNLRNLGSGLGIVGLSAGDWNGDGDDELLVSSISSWDLLCLHNRGNGTAAPVFDPANSEILGSGVGGSALLNRASPAIGDIDGDGDNDVCFPQRATATMWVLKNDLIDENTRTPRIVRFLDEPPTQPKIGGYVDSDYTLRVEIDRPQVVSGSATHMEIVAWRQADPTQFVDRASRMSWSIPLQGNPVQPPPYEVVVPLPSGSSSLTQGSAEHRQSFDELVWISAQLVRRAPSAIRRWPGCVLVFHGQGVPGTGPLLGTGTPGSPPTPTPNEDFVMTVITAGSRFQVEMSLPPGIAPGGDGQDIGSGGDVPCLPLPPDGPPN